MVAAILLAGFVMFPGQSTSADIPLPVVEPRAPGPEGILPCVERRVVLTAAYRQGNSIRFEGVARFSLRGMPVEIRAGRAPVAETIVRDDGTFWGRATDPDMSFGGRTTFQAIANGHQSWARRLGQTVTIRERTPEDSEVRAKNPRIEVSVRIGGVPDLVLTRQFGCRKQRARALRVTSTSPDGKAVVSLPRPARGAPYAIYRLVAQGGSLISSPLVVRPAR